MSKTGHWMPIYWADYVADTQHLSTFQHGCYLLLISAYWLRAGPLPNEPNYLAQVCRTTKDKLARYGNPVLAMFTAKDGLLHHKRIDLEILKSSDRLAAAVANGRAGGLAKSYLSTTTSTKEERKNLSNEFLVGKNGKKNGQGNGSVTILDPAERLSRFQRTLAQALGQDGWVTVCEAADPSNARHGASLAVCKAKAKEIGKGWPKQWPGL